MTEDLPRFHEAGERSLVVELGDTIDTTVNDRVRGLMMAMERLNLPGIEDLIPSYRSLLIVHDPIVIEREDLIEAASAACRELGAGTEADARVVTLPTLYGGEHGPDLDYVAEHAGMDPDEVVELHSGAKYRVYMIGFAPGFPYMGGLPAQLATPRLASPRIRIPPGSVGIAESQTGVYPAASPGGWRLIGRTPVRLFDPERRPPSVVVAGDFIRFSPLGSESEYDEVDRLAARGEFEPEAIPVGQPAPSTETT